jgi:hypothetical protein
MGTNITGFTKCNHKTSATLYTVKHGLFGYVIVNTLTKLTPPPSPPPPTTTTNNNNNNNNNNNKPSTTRVFVVYVGFCHDNDYD